MSPEPCDHVFNYLYKCCVVFVVQVVKFYALGCMSSHTKQEFSSEFQRIQSGMFVTCNNIFNYCNFDIL
jgi:hypothetical protein